MKTVLTIKTEKEVKEQAQRVAEEFGIPLGTIINAFLRQFVRNKEFSLEISSRPSKYLRDIILESEKDLARGEVNEMSEKEFFAYLKKAVVVL